MSRADTTLVVAFCVVIPFAAALLLALAGSAERMRKAIALLYAAVSSGFTLALLSGYLQHPSRATWGGLRFTALSYPAFFMLNMLTVGAVLYACFRSSGLARPSVLAASIPAACGFGGLALAVATLMPQVFLWLGASAAALVGLAAHGGTGAVKRFRSFIPWLVSDALFVVGAILCSVLLRDNAVLIKPPVTSGSETQVVIVMALFLASALVRLGVFPLQGWIAESMSRTDASWNSYYLGSLNFLMAGMRLVIAAALLARLVASDWSIGLAIAGMLSMLAGPLLAARADSVQGAAGGLYCMQSGMLLLALSLYSRAGQEGALFILITAPLALTAFMMSTGTASALRGSSSLGQHMLEARAAPSSFVATTVAGLSLSGMPVLVGFVASVNLAFASLDKANVTQYFVLGAVAALVASAIALVVVARVLAGSFSAATPSAAATRPRPFEGLVPVTACGFCVLLGIFPGLLFRNFIGSASRLLFAPGFQGPAIVFHGTGDAIAAALRGYLSWAPIIAAFVGVIASVVLVAYFTSRAARPSEGPAEHSAPFLGGARGTYSSSWSAHEGAYESVLNALSGIRRRASAGRRP